MLGVALCPLAQPADHLTRMDFIILDERGYLPFAQSGGQLRELVRDDRIRPLCPQEVTKR
jgi:hypothetical protein